MKKYLVAVFCSVALSLICKLLKLDYVSFFLIAIYIKIFSQNENLKP